MALWWMRWDRVGKLVSARRAISHPVQAAGCQLSNHRCWSPAGTRQPMVPHKLRVLGHQLALDNQWYYTNYRLLIIKLLLLATSWPSKSNGSKNMTWAEGPRSERNRRTTCREIAIRCRGFSVRAIVDEHIVLFLVVASVSRGNTVLHVLAAQYPPGISPRSTLPVNPKDHHMIQRCIQTCVDMHE
jgi:hypothetical protein